MTLNMHNIVNLKTQFKEGKLKLGVLVTNIEFLLVIF